MYEVEITVIPNETLSFVESALIRNDFKKSEEFKFSDVYMLKNSITRNTTIKKIIANSYIIRSTSVNFTAFGEEFNQDHINNNINTSSMSSQKKGDRRLEIIHKDKKYNEIGEVLYETKNILHLNNETEDIEGAINFLTSVGYYELIRLNTTALTYTLLDEALNSDNIYLYTTNEKLYIEYEKKISSEISQEYIAILKTKLCDRLKSFGITFQTNSLNVSRIEIELKKIL